MKYLLMVVLLVTMTSCGVFTKAKAIDIYQAPAQHSFWIVCDTQDEVGVMLEAYDALSPDLNAIVDALHKVGAKCDMAEWAMLQGDDGAQIKSGGRLWQVINILVVGKDGKEVTPVRRATAYEIYVPGVDL